MFRYLARPVSTASTVLFLSLAMSPAAQAESRNLAPGFHNLPKGTSIAIMPPDIELFSISAGGIGEPKADWTEAALKHVQKALVNKSASLGLQIKQISDSDADDLAEINALHGAVGRSIALHHFSSGILELPTKEKKLDWSLGEAVQPLREKLGTDYALFIWMRDSYASAERKAAMVALALLGVGIGGGVQSGYASLVDLRDGQILWFNRLGRVTGDLREEEPAGETVAALLAAFPESR